MENFHKELKCVRKSQMKILELKNTATEIKNLLDGFNREEDKITELEDRFIKISKMMNKEETKHHRSANSFPCH